MNMLQENLVCSGRTEGFLTVGAQDILLLRFNHVLYNHDVTLKWEKSVLLKMVWEVRKSE